MRNEVNDTKLNGFIEHCRHQINVGNRYVSEDDMIEYRAIFDWLKQLQQIRKQNKPNIIKRMLNKCFDCLLNWMLP